MSRLRIRLGNDTKKYMENIIKTVIIVVAILAIGAMAFLKTGDYLDYRRELSRFEAIDNCARASFMETKHISGERESTTTEPIRDIYNYCLLDKGIVVGE